MHARCTHGALSAALLRLQIARKEGAREASPAVQHVLALSAQRSHRGALALEVREHAQRIVDHLEHRACFRRTQERVPRAGSLDAIEVKRAHSRAPLFEELGDSAREHTVGEGCMTFLR